MKKFFSLLTIIILITMIFAGCSSEINGESDALKVVTTTTMITDLVKIIGGDFVEVEGLMGSGIDPHLYKASASDVTKLQNAQLIIYNGFHLEGKIGDLLEEVELNGVSTFAVAESVDPSKLLLCDEIEGNHDPHIWFDVAMWIDAANEVTEVLSNQVPEHKEDFESNAKEYIQALNELNDHIIAQVNTISEESRILITAHDAFNYFGEAYGFEVLGLQGISTTSEAGTADITALADYIVQKEIPAIFIETSVPPKGVEALREAVRAQGFEVEIGGELFSDALGDKGTDTESYIGTVRHNIDTIVSALHQ
ncbi:manganese/zinc/iron transport system substrate-binding protein [Natranaerovirga hydrolytica]|uniref:Manganese/zinc/iron transport system substrate-binding protein n=1 Tax=Natranaerovirga hydrolytica TaxID=680378 RepID=A0A4R1N6G6_9FIRM|nr:zinc ABC transporter substrate-binding protein [Natranaerovirga hydrolytica]TCK98619.1 manganese/zinc/iron transport system substrate-binding protein [Natranaerovirga hydrolytica]